MAIHKDFSNIKNSNFNQVYSLDFDGERIRASVDIGSLDYLWFNDIEEVKVFRDKIESGSKYSIKVLDEFIKHKEDKIIVINGNRYKRID